MSCNMSLISNLSALKIADLLDRLPEDVLGEIYEFNSEHAEKWRKVMSSMLRFVFCPSYFHAIEDDIYIQRMTHKWAANEIKFQFCCEVCSVNKKSPRDVLFQIKNADVTGSMMTMCEECESRSLMEDNFVSGNTDLWDDFDVNEDFDFEIDESDFDP